MGELLLRGLDRGCSRSVRQERGALDAAVARASKLAAAQTKAQITAEAAGRTGQACERFAERIPGGRSGGPPSS
eukprot:3630655-Pyramimonas_sp.AAC.1